MADDCQCCGGDCPTCNDVPDYSCCGKYVPTEPYVCVRPAPSNRSACPVGNRYGCDELFQLYEPEPDTFDDAQLAVIEQVIVSAMVYFPNYSTLNFGSCGCNNRIMYGREPDCLASWMGGLYPGPKTACTPIAPQEKLCGCGCGKGTSLLKHWTPTTPDQCCQIPVLDAEGNPLLDADGNPVTEPAQLMFGAVPATHPHWTRYGGQSSPPIDFDHIMPATASKIIGLLCAMICAFQKGGPSAATK